jgi:hypothetical protein
MRFPYAPASVAAVTLAGLLAVSTPASAFCRTTTVPVPADYDPQQGCWTQGKPLYWLNHCVGYSLNRDASRKVTLAQATDGLAVAFSRWSEASCDGGGKPTVAAVDEGPVACTSVRYNQNIPNAHVIVFRDDAWPHLNDANNTLALTTVTFNVDDGEIYDADMEINSTQNISVSAVPPAGSYDFASIVTHEAGHFLGLAHSVDNGAIMFAHYKPGGAVSLTADDRAGICTIYDPGGTRSSASGAVPQASCDATPRHGFTTCELADGGITEPADVATAKTSSGCATSPASPGGSGGGGSTGAASVSLVALVAASLALARRRAGLALRLVNRVRGGVR